MSEKLALNPRDSAAWAKRPTCECDCGCPLLRYPSAKFCPCCERGDHRSPAIQARPGWTRPAAPDASNGGTEA
jgi:hypothetical protein